MEEQQKNGFLYAKNFSEMPIMAEQYLMMRDLPVLVKKYVRGNKALDYGCGSGKSAVVLKSAGLDVEGVDINEHMIDFAKKYDPAGRYNIIKSAKVPVASETYDLVYAGNVLPYASSKSVLLEIAVEIARVLKPGGVFISGQANPCTYKNKWLHTIADSEENKNPTSGAIVTLAWAGSAYRTWHYYWTRADYLEVFAKAGFEYVDKHDPLGNDSDGFEWINERDVPLTTFLIVQKRQ